MAGILQAWLFGIRNTMPAIMTHNDIIMTYNETIDYLYNAAPAFTKVGAVAYKDGLANTRALDRHAGHPHRPNLPVQVAGTNAQG